MSILNLKDIEKAYGAEKILRGVTMNVEAGDRAGLIGVNGCGKTTLLNIICGVSKPDAGDMAVSKGLNVGCLAQDTFGGGARAMLDEMLSARPEVLEARHRLDALSSEISRLAAGGGSDYERAMDEYADSLEEFGRSGGYSYDNEVSGALKGLGFSREDFSRRLDTLSGGQRTRLALAKLLLAGHGLLVLDEPTNHLDVSAIAWLEDFIAKYEGAVLMVSHDRRFLDKVAGRIFELEGGRVEEYPGNFSAYQAEKERRVAERLKRFELMSGRYEKEKEYINRMRAGQNARQAKGREKRLSRFEMPDRPASDKKALSLEWAEVKRSSDTVIAAHGVGKSFGGNEVLKEITFSLRRGEKAGIVGRNGGGKSTLLKIIMGELQPDSGTVVFGPKVKPAYYAQGLECLTGENTVLDELWTAEPLAPEQKMRDTLGAFLFSGDDALKKVASLSGGEKGRLALAKVSLAGANLLVLDEPTNHLDIPSREALEAALSGFGGAIIAVSHDRYFLDSAVDKIFEIEDGRMTAYWGDYSYYASKKSGKSAPPDEASARKTEGRQDCEGRKQMQAEDKKKEREQTRKVERMRSIESEIEDVERRIREAERELADPEIYVNFFRVSELTQCYNILKGERDKLYDLLEGEAV